MLEKDHIQISQERRPHYHAQQIEVLGARVHNLKNIDVRFPRNQLIVLTGVSGSGKSSLAFDTIYAEGQRRYLETFASYARSFIGDLERPDVDKINGLSPVIAIEQKTTSRNPRSTVGTVTEIYDYLRLLYAKVADAYSYASGHKMIKQTEEQIITHILKAFLGQKINLLAPLVKGRKGHYRELFQQLAKLGFSKVRVDGEIQDIVPKMQVDRYKIHDIELVVDRLIVDQDDKQRLNSSLRTTLQHGDDGAMLEDESGKIHHFSKALVDPLTGLSYPEPAPNAFSFNSPYGACTTCEGLGMIKQVDLEAIMPDKQLSVQNGGIRPFGPASENHLFKEIKALFKNHQVSLDTPLDALPAPLLQVLLYGQVPEEEETRPIGKKVPKVSLFKGVMAVLEEMEAGSYKERAIQESYHREIICTACHGDRLNPVALHFKLLDKNIAQLAKMNLQQLYDFLDQLMPHLTDRQQIIASELLKELKKRIIFLLNVGLYYLALNRPLGTLSGGESQRIRLATQIGTQLVGVLYILDEPSIGLHQRDNVRLIEALQELRDLGNSIIVVEHDKDMMLASDYLLDIGPGAGKHGGEVIAAGTPEEFLKQPSITAEFLSGIRKIALPTMRRPGNGEWLKITGCRGHNLKNVTLNLPLGKLICVTGVSGSGKSTLIHQTLYPILQKQLNKAYATPLPYDQVIGLVHLDKVIEIDQKPIGRTPRSNPATYTNVFTAIRTLFSQLPEAKIRGYQPGRFSFNISGGRCETCHGGGMRVIEMEFLPDVHVLCEACQGKRYVRETLEVQYKNKSISDVLEMTISNALDFFDKHPTIRRLLEVLEDVGLGYLTLGQSATTLSGGEAQRVKLATELAKRDTGKTFYILDEPTTGLHFQDIQLLIEVLNKLVDRGNTVLIVEHNLDVIKVADYIIDIGPEGGERGGQVLVEGTPEEVIQYQESHTAKFLKIEMQ